jgi:hypothetical protein
MSQSLVTTRHHLSSITFLVRARIVWRQEVAGQAGRNGEVKNKRRTWRPSGRAVLIMDIVVDIADEAVAVEDTEGEVATAEMANQVRGVDVVDIEVAEMQQSCSKFSPIVSNS